MTIVAPLRDDGRRPALACVLTRDMWTQPTRSNGVMISRNSPFRSSAGAKTPGGSAPRLLARRSGFTRSWVRPIVVTAPMASAVGRAVGFGSGFGAATAVGAGTTGFGVGVWTLTLARERGTISSDRATIAETEATIATPATTANTRSIHPIAEIPRLARPFRRQATVDLAQRGHALRS